MAKGNSPAPSEVGGAPIKFRVNNKKRGYEKARLSHEWGDDFRMKNSEIISI